MKHSGCEKLLTPLNFSLFAIKHQKERKRRKINTYSTSPWMLVQSISCSSLGTTITIIVIGVNTCMALTVSGGGVASGTPRLLSLTVSLQGLIPICCSSLLLLLLLIILII